MGAAPFDSKGAGFSSMRKPPRRYYGQGHLHFVTFSCHRRRPYLGTRRARDHFVRVLDQVRARWKFVMIGYVVMPEHVHLLMSEPREGNPPRVLQVLKQKVSLALRAKRSKTSRGQVCLQFDEGGEDFRQRRFYDFNVWSARKVQEKLDYTHANPVKRKLVLHRKECSWSSWSY